VHHCTNCTTFAPEILKISRNVPKASKNGLKRSAEHASCRNVKCRELIIVDRYYFGKKGFGSFCNIPWFYRILFFVL
jgi:hypothetical protein